jgi:hypothetical protein
MSDRRRPSVGRSCSHDDLHTAQVCSIAGGGFHQGKERDPSGAGIRGAQAELCRSEFLGPGYFVSTVGRDETTIREYIRSQEKEDERLDQMNLWK